MYSFLLTDDEQIVIDTLTLIIRRNFGEDIKIFSALSGSAALDIVHKEKIDIMFMDIHMPGINGLEAINLIKQINQNIIVIILSAYDQFEYAQEAINLGAFKYLTKPNTCFAHKLCYHLINLNCKKRQSQFSCNY